MNRTATGQREDGFSLVELMIVVVIIGIISAIAYPAYQRNVRESNRSEAQTALVTFASLQERFYSDNNSYGQIGTTCTRVNVGTPTEHGYYNLTAAIGVPDPLDPTACNAIVPTESGAPNCRITANHASCYVLTASAVSTGPQSRDTGCTTMTLTSTGVKTPAACWR